MKPGPGLRRRHRRRRDRLAGLLDRRKTIVIGGYPIGSTRTVAVLVHLVVAERPITLAAAGHSAAPWLVGS